MNSVASQILEGSDSTKDSKRQSLELFKLQLEEFLRSPLAKRFQQALQEERELCESAVFNTDLTRDSNPNLLMSREQIIGQRIAYQAMENWFEAELIQTNVAIHNLINNQ